MGNKIVYKSNGIESNVVPKLTLAITHNKRSCEIIQEIKKMKYKHGEFETIRVNVKKIRDDMKEMRSQILKKDENFEYAEKDVIKIISELDENNQSYSNISIKYDAINEYKKSVVDKYRDMVKAYTNGKTDKFANLLSTIVDNYIKGKDINNLSQEESKKIGEIYDTLISYMNDKPINKTLVDGTKIKTDEVYKTLEIIDPNGKKSKIYLSNVGNQMFFKYNNTDLLKDERVRKIVRKYWPNATTEDIELLMYKLCSVGCGYVASINTLFEQYKNKPEEFEKKFGFPMIKYELNNEVNYSHEYLELEYFCYIWRNEKIEDLYDSNNKDVMDMALVRKNSSSNTTVKGVATGTTLSNQLKFENFLKTYNIESEITYKTIKDISDYETFVKSIRNIIDNHDKHIYVNATGWELTSVEDGKKVKADSGEGGHSMLIKDIKNDGTFLVSSWGKDYILDLRKSDIFNSSKIKKDDWCWFTTINYK